MTFLLDIINGINKFLGYLDISPKYLNRGYTILSIIPTVYILRIIYGLWSNGRYVQFFLYALVFLIFVYFFVLNFFYYFLNKNLKFDITQLFVKVLPDDAFNIQSEEKKRTTAKMFKNAKEVSVNYHDDYQLTLAANIQTMIVSGEIKTNDLAKREGFLIDENTLYPYYYVKKLSESEYSLQIGQNYQSLSEIGRIHQEEPLATVGLFIVGGDFSKGGITYHEPYRLKLMAKDENKLEEKSGATRSGRRSRHEADTNSIENSSNEETDFSSTSSTENNFRRSRRQK